MGKYSHMHIVFSRSSSSCSSSSSSSCYMYVHIVFVVVFRYSIVYSWTFIPTMWVAVWGVDTLGCGFSFIHKVDGFGYIWMYFRETKQVYTYYIYI